MKSPKPSFTPRPTGEGREGEEWHKLQWLPVPAHRKLTFFRILRLFSILLRSSASCRRLPALPWRLRLLTI